MQLTFRTAEISLILGLLVLLGVPTTAVGQPTDGLVFGVRAGINISTFRSDLVDFKYQTGPVFGVFAVGSLGSNFAVQPELHFSRMGAKDIFDIVSYSAPPVIGGGKFYWVLDYFELRFLLKRYLTSQGTIRPAVMAGPTIGYLIRAKRKVVKPDEMHKFDAKDDYREFALGNMIGLSADATFGGGVLSLDVRYVFGVLKANHGEAGFYNTGFTFTVGLTL